MAVQIASARSPLPEGGEFTSCRPSSSLHIFKAITPITGDTRSTWAQSIVTHFVVSSLDPTEIGIDYRRRVKLVGDVVTLKTIPRATDTSGSHNVLSWRRV